MAFCANCGAQVSGTFCQNCGTPVAGGATPTGAGAGYVPPSSPIAAPGLTDNVASALCYLFGLVTGIIFLLIAPYNQNKTIRFHAFQSIFMHVAIFILWILYAMTSFLTHGLGFLLAPLFGLLVIVLWLYMMYTAYNNKKVKLPVVGDLAEKQA
jgi:uncharacterized membrane protein